MAISPRPARTTRLSSGSVQKRTYVDISSDSSSDEDSLLPARGQPKGKGRQDSASQRAAAKRAKKEEKARRKKYADSDEDSASDFVDEDASESSEGEALHASEGEEESDDDDDDDDDDNFDTRKRASATKKRKVSGQQAKAKARTCKGKQSTAKAAHVASEGATQVARAPSSAIPTDRISSHTVRFMADLQDPDKNDRDWFAVHKSVYDWIHQNWLNFTETCVDVMIDRVDDTIAWMKPKDLVERIYRDVRFSNDKTPYKRHLSWCMSRNGKKGNFAKYYFSLMGNDQSGLYAGVYEASKEDLDTIRGHILNKTAQGRALQQLVKDAQFCTYFGAPPKSSKDTKRTSLWNSEDELKRAPKGYEPDHPDVQWLRLKSYTIGHKFTDEDILASDFLDKLVDVGRVAARLVEIMNEMLHGAPPQMPANGA